MARQAIDAQPSPPPAYGLIIAAPLVDTTDRWQDGVTWAPIGACGGVEGVSAISCGAVEDALTDSARAPLGVADPVVLWASDRCSILGGLASSREQRARDNLTASQSFLLAAELWDGGSGTANAALIDSTSDTVTDGPTSATGALAALVSALGTLGRGRRGMIHVPTQVLTHLVSVGAIYREGGLWLAPMGHIVVADDGYSGNGPGAVPAGASQWGYATDMLRLRLGEVLILPTSPDTPEGMRQGMDRSDNSMVVYAERLALVQWDQCVHVAAEFALAVPLIAGAS